MSSRLLLALVLLAAAACGHGPAPAAARPSVPLGAMPVLLPAAVPGVPSTTRALTSAELGKDAAISGLQGRLASWGYLDGRERTFQGQSHHLTFAVSRALVFRDGTGARAFVTFVRQHAAAYFGVAVQAEPLRAQRRTGWLFRPAACACHMANPVYVGVLDDGPRVIWLEINGPDATATLLRRLLDPARSAATTVQG